MERNSDFNFFVLKLDDIATESLDCLPASVIDCAHLHFHEILEEVYAGIFQRNGRLAWLRVNPEFPQHSYHSPNPLAGPYAAFESKSGLAVSVQWNDDPSEPIWSLEFEFKGRLQRIEGRSKDEILDPDIRCGDYIGFARKIGLFVTGPQTIWMRSNDLSLRMSSVEMKYLEKLNELKRL